MRQWAAWILSGALILAGIVYKSWPLVSAGAAVLGFPGIVPQELATGPDQKSMSKMTHASSTPEFIGQPETDISVRLPEDGENQTLAREEFVKNIGLEKL